MTGLRHRLTRLERGAMTAPQGVRGPRVFESAYEGLRLLEADLRDRADSWTPDQRVAMAELTALGWSSGTKFEDLPDDELGLLAKVALQRFAPG